MHNRVYFGKFEIEMKFRSGLTKEGDSVEVVGEARGVARVAAAGEGERVGARVSGQLGVGGDRLPRRRGRAQRAHHHRHQVRHVRLPQRRHV